MEKNNGVKFIRVKGRVIPIKQTTQKQENRYAKQRLSADRAKLGGNIGFLAGGVAAFKYVADAKITRPFKTKQVSYNFSDGSVPFKQSFTVGKPGIPKLSFSKKNPLLTGAAVAYGASFGLFGGAILGSIAGSIEGAARFRNKKK